MAVLDHIAASDRVMAALVAGLDSEFGQGAGMALAAHYLAAEEVDFHWDARSRERWLGSYQGLDESDLELDRVAILGRLDEQWFVAICLVDGDGRAHGIAGRREFAGLEAAEMAYVAAR